MPVIQIFTLLNGIIGALLLASGAITTYLDTLGAARWASVVLGALGVVQLIIANILHVIQSPTPAQKSAPSAPLRPGV